MFAIPWGTIDLDKTCNELEEFKIEFETFSRILNKKSAVKFLYLMFDKDTNAKTIIEEFEPELISEDEDVNNLMDKVRQKYNVDKFEHAKRISVRFGKTLCEMKEPYVETMFKNWLTFVKCGWLAGEDIPNEHDSDKK